MLDFLQIIIIPKFLDISLINLKKILVAFFILTNLIADNTKVYFEVEIQVRSIDPSTEMILRIGYRVHELISPNTRIIKSTRKCNMEEP